MIDDLIHARDTDGPEVSGGDGVDRLVAAAAP